MQHTVGAAAAFHVVYATLADLAMLYLCHESDQQRYTALNQPLQPTASFCTMLWVRV
jgi:hypothetical protein